MLHKSLSFATFISIACIGCASNSDIERATAEAVSEQQDARATWQSEGRTGTVEDGWLASFNDPQLTALVVEALDNNPSLAEAAAGVEQAQALARQAGASLVPSVDATVTGSRSGLVEDGPGPSNSINAGLQVSWEVDLWGRIRSGVNQATASAAAARADYEFAQRSIAANTAIAYFTAIEAQLLKDVAETSLELLQKTLRIVEAQHREGAASAQDLALARSDFAAAQDSVTTAEGAERSALRALELLIGRYPSAELSLRSSLPSTPALPPAGLPADLLERRPDLIAAERRVAAAFNATAQAKAARLPSLSLTSTLGGSSNALSDVLNPSNLAWSVGTSLLAPIFDGGRRRENVTIANAQQDGALAQYRSAALAAFSDVESALDQGTVLERRQRALQEAVTQAREAYRLADLRYKEGESSLIDLLTIQQRQITAESSLTSIQRLALQQRVNLNLALGGHWE